ncbi:non-specific serine,threonine protein kinase [Sarracenia purpurea var. burkii]
MMIKTDDSITFAVGKVSSSGADGTTIEFSSAKTADDVLKGSSSSQEMQLGLPAGKLIPGKLIKGKEMRFIPGTMIDNKFIPGQFVTTGSEEKFIPGQVIETNEGPKFVPGQVLQTKSGPKFVPGQTMETEDGPKFIPGQIIETKSGPTFIPGQVIYTEEEGSRFVPGQVVDTSEGPRFVPGRVVETGIMLLLSQAKLSRPKMVSSSSLLIWKMTSKEVISSPCRASKLPKRS